MDDRTEDAVDWGADPVCCGSMSERRAQFDADGFIVLERLIEPELCIQLQARLEKVLRGQFDVAAGRPDKAPKFNADPRSKPGKVPPPLGGPSKQTLQLINIWKADRLFRQLVTSRRLAKAVAELGGWESGARIANDQVWAKPPGAAPLTFHRDSAYFDFVPADVITVWIALDDMEPILGPLEYVRGSHHWEDGRVGSANQFFDARDRFALLYDAARREGVADPRAELQVSQVCVRAGGCGIHNGRLWHGSDRNASPTKPRRGVGIHFVPADAVLREAEGRTLAHRLNRACLDEAGSHVAPSPNELHPALFPVTYRPTSGDTCPFAAQASEPSPPYSDCEADGERSRNATSAMAGAAGWPTTPCSAQGAEIADLRIDSSHRPPIHGHTEL